MRKSLIAVILSALFLTGCGDTKATTYDGDPRFNEVDLIVYEACINEYISKVGLNGALDFCQEFRPKSGIGR